MSSSRIRMAFQRDEVPPNTFPDFEWARQHRMELLGKYGPCVLRIYERQVVVLGKRVSYF